MLASAYYLTNDVLQYSPFWLGSDIHSHSSLLYSVLAGGTHLIDLVGSSH